jgi:IMP dehydrogenase
VVVVDDGVPVGVFTERDGEGFDRFTQLVNVMSSSLHILSPDIDPATAFDHLGRNRLRVAPVVDDGRLLGVITREGALRSTIYEPAVDAHGRLMVGVAVGINGDPAGVRRHWSAMGSTCSCSTPRTVTRPARFVPSRRSGRCCPTPRSSPATW